MSKDPVKVLCVDDHAFVVEGLAARLEVELGMTVVERLDTADDLVEAVQRSGAAIVLIDIEMPGRDPFDALDDLRRHCPDVKVIMLSAYVRDHYIDEAYRVGAWGYLSKSDPPEAVVEGIRKVAAGEPAFSAEVLRRSTPPAKASAGPDDAPRSRLALLTTREQQILRMIAKGLSRTEIAEQLSRSPMTVDNHRKSIMRKLEISDRTELVRYALAEGLVEL